MLTQGCQS
jgi:hypothetical protein